jgi:hypothetical protein
MGRGLRNQSAPDLPPPQGKFLGRRQRSPNTPAQFQADDYVRTGGALLAPWRRKVSGAIPSWRPLVWCHIPPCRVLTFHAIRKVDCARLEAIALTRRLIFGAEFFRRYAPEQPGNDRRQCD